MEGRLLMIRQAQTSWLHPFSMTDAGVPLTNSSVFRGMIHLPSRQPSSHTDERVIPVQDPVKPLRYLFILLNYDPTKVSGGPITMERASVCMEMSKIADKYDVSFVMGVVVGVLWEQMQFRPIRVLPVAVELNNLQLTKMAVTYLAH